MDELVQRLSQGKHPVVISRIDGSVAEMRRCVERGYVHVKFTDTRGGTELGIRLDKEACHEANADSNVKTGFIHLEGNLTLNYVNVKCVADIAMNSLQGLGHLEILDAN